MALFLLRHGETEWSRSHRHTGRTDVPLTPAGEAQAEEVGRRLGGIRFAAVWSSPLSRARRTAELARLRPPARILDDLAEFDYGRYEGLTRDEILRQHKGWDLWRDGGAGGESPETVLVRARRALHRIGVDSPPGDVAIVSHGHLLRALAVAYLDCPITAAGALMLDVASLSVLDAEHGRRAVRRWNLGPGAGAPAASASAPSPAG